MTGDLCTELNRGLKRTTFDPQWYRPSSLAELVAIARGNEGQRIRLVAGDTGKGLSHNIINTVQREIFFWLNFRYQALKSVFPWSYFRCMP